MTAKKNPVDPAITTPGKSARRLQIALLLAQTVFTCIFLLSLGSIISAALDGALNAVVLVTAVLTLLASAATNYAANEVSGASKAGVESQLRMLLVSHALRLGPARMTKTQAGSLVSMATDSVDRVANYRQSFLATTLCAMLTPILTLAIIALTIDPLAALVLFAFVPVILATIYAFQKLFRKVSGASRKARTKLANEFLEALQGLRTLVNLRAADRVGDRLTARGEENRVATMSLLARNQLVILVTDAAFSLFMIASSVLVAWWRLDAGHIDAAQSISLVLLSTQLCAPLAKMGSLFYVGMAGRAGQRQMADFLARQAPESTPGAPSTAEQGVYLSKVDFSYEEKPVLTRVNLAVEPGQKAVLLGRSGSGKSTLLSLIGGDLVPTSGTVSVDGIQLNTNSQDAVRARSAVVRQKTWLFVGTLADNLAVGNPRANEREMWDALAQVGLDGWARSLPDGLQTQVGERGMSMSGGQAQRLSIARAILSGRELLLLDEPTSQVDIDSERVILEAIDRLCADHTVILATHREASAQNASLIYNVEEK